MRQDKGLTALSVPSSLLSLLCFSSRSGLHEAVAGEAEVSRLMCKSDLSSDSSHR